MSKLAAFFMAVYLFIAGLFYGNAPVQVEILESPFDNGPVTVQVPHHAGGVFEENGQTVTYWNVSGNWAFRCKNTGRPIKGESHYQPTVTLIPAQPDQPELRVITVSDDMVGHDVLIKHGETFTIGVRLFAFGFIPSGRLRRCSLLLRALRGPGRLPATGSYKAVPSGTRRFGRPRL